jgi:S-adenosylmethionine:tRNA ribosyltransferase-isomerase
MLSAGDVLVLNETRVTALRLFGTREETGGTIELLVLRRTPNGPYACLAKPARRLQPGVKLVLPNGLVGTVEGVGMGGERFVSFSDPERLSEIGQAPLPPYIKRTLADSARYQTVYASQAGNGSAAAPTAGLHFTPGLLREVEERGVSIARVCLDVGIDTFRPVQVEDLSEHTMHGEACTVPAAAARLIASASGRVVAVGTTTVRTLETFARSEMSSGRDLAPGALTSTLFLRPGSTFRVVDAMLTNFHLPRTTMLVMLSAFAGRDKVMAAYEKAVGERYRFLSFGDAMLII